MIISTTCSLEGHAISDYLGIVSATQLIKMRISDPEYNKGWPDAISTISASLCDAAADRGADAVIGVRFELQHNNIIFATGTAVQLKKP